MSPKTIAACSVCLVSGLVLGRLSSSLDSGDRATGEGVSGKDRPHDSPIPASSQNWDRGMDARRDSKRKPREEREESQAWFGDAASVVVPLSLIEELGKAGGVGSLDGELFGRGDGMEGLLKIVDSEKAAIQTAWRDSRRQVRELEAKSAVMVEGENGSAKISVPELAADREAIRQRFQTGVEKTLGEGRGEVFLAAKQVDKAFAPQEGGWSCIIAPESVGDGSWRFHMTLKNAQGSRNWVGATIPDELRHLTDAVGIISSLEQNPGSSDEGC